MLAIDEELYDELVEFKRAHESWTTFFKRHMDLGLFRLSREKPKE